MMLLLMPFEKTTNPITTKNLKLFQKLIKMFINKRDNRVDRAQSRPECDPSLPGGLNGRRMAAQGKYSFRDESAQNLTHSNRRG